MSSRELSMWYIQSHCLSRYDIKSFLVLACNLHSIYYVFKSCCLPAGGSIVQDQKVKGCVLNEECGEGSGNSGYFKISVNTLCCNSNLCNTQSVPEPSKTTPNGRQCFTCDGSACNKTLDCEGNEDNCGTGTGQTHVLHLFLTIRKENDFKASDFPSLSVNLGEIYTINGCISKKLCSALNGYLSQLLQTKITCAKGYLCNSAVTASAGLQLVVVALVSLILFS
uniref:UPAR/Ly6 domain-containing protein n=1 Tax=Oryzias sinensis TaxID=183150 RepID=A0A8C7YM21_9TELE